MAKTTIGLTTTRWEPVTRMAERWQTAFIVPEVKRLGYKQVGHDTPFAHKPAFRAAARQSQVLTGVGHGGKCYSEDTEILTENGWKYFFELEKGEKVATLNPETYELEYQEPTHYFEYDYDGKMFYVNGRRVNLLVTPNHKLYVSLRGKSEWYPFKFIEAQNIGKKGVENKSGRFTSTGYTTGEEFKFKKTAKWNCTSMQCFTLPQTSTTWVIPSNKQIFEKIIPPVSIKIDDWLRFFGIWLAEGTSSCIVNTKKGRKKGYHYIISIPQGNDEKRDNIKKWVDAVCKQIGCTAWIEKTKNRVEAIKFKSKQLYNYLKQFGKAGEKYIPKEIKMLPPDKLKILLNAMVLGDGTIKGNTIRYSTISKKLADDVQEIALKIGKSATISVMPEREGKRRNWSVAYIIGITDRDAETTKRSWSWIDYKGKVYCVEVPNHLVYVRRYGKPVWAGNSEYTGDLFSTLLEKSKYPKWVVEGKQFILLSCLTGAELGPDTIKKGAAGYAGYVKTYTFDSDPKYQARPESDPVLRFFFLPWTQHVLDFIRGKTNWESWLREWNGYVKGAPETHDPQLRDLLCREANIMRCQGDPNARLVKGKIEYSKVAAKANPEGKKKEACVKPEKGKTKESEEAAWSEFKDLIKKDRFEKAAAMYQKFVNILPAERSRLVTCIPKAYLIPPAMPRAMIPLNIRLRTPFGKEFIKVVKEMPRSIRW